MRLKKCFRKGVFFVGIIVLSFLYTSATAQNKVEVNRDYQQDISKIKKGGINLNLSDTLNNPNLKFNYTIFDKKLKNIYNFSPLPSSSLSSKRIAEYPSMVVSASIKYPFGFDGAIFHQPDIFKGKDSLKNSLSFSFSTSNVKDKRELMDYSSLGQKNDMYKNSLGFKGLDERHYSDIDVNYNHTGDWGEFDIDLFAKSSFSTYYGLDLNRSMFVGGEEYINKLKGRKFVKNNASHNYSQYGLNLNLKNSLKEETNFLYDVNLIYSNTKDKANLAGEVFTWQNPALEGARYKLKENYLKFSMECGPTIGKYSMVTLGIGSESAFYTGWQKMNTSILDLSLRYQLIYNGWILNLGAKGAINFNNQKGWDHYHTYIVPMANVSYALNENNLWFYGSIEGDNYLNSYSSMLERTNWIYPGTTLQESSIPWSGKVGFKGSLSKNLTFDINGGYTKHRGLMQFRTINSKLTTIFSQSGEPTGIVLSPLDAYFSSHNEYFVNGALSFESERFKGGSEVRFSNFSKYEGAPAIGRAKIEANVWGEFNHRERIFVGVEGYYKGKAPMFNTPIYAKSYFNLSIYGRYVMDHNMTLFAQLGNILNAKIQNYGMYLERGINGSFGILIKL